MNITINTFFMKWWVGCLLSRLWLRLWQTKTHCCRHKCFPVCPRARAQHLLILCPLRNECFPVCAAWKQNIHFVSGNIMSNNVSSFASHPLSDKTHSCVPSFAALKTKQSQVLTNKPVLEKNWQTMWKHVCCSCKISWYRQRAGNRSDILAEPHTYRNPSTTFLMVIMASAIARGRDRTATTTTATSYNI